MGDQDERLIRKSPPQLSHGLKIWILTHPDIKDVERIKVFTNFMSQVIQQEEDLILGRKIDFR